MAKLKSCCTGISSQTVTMPAQGQGGSTPQQHACAIAYLCVLCTMNIYLCVLLFVLLNAQPFQHLCGFIKKKSYSDKGLDIKTAHPLIHRKEEIVAFFLLYCTDILRLRFFSSNVLKLLNVSIPETKATRWVDIYDSTDLFPASSTSSEAPVTPLIGECT